MFTKLHGTFWTGFSTHGTPQDGNQSSSDSTGYFATDTVSTGHHGMGLTDHGITRDVLRGIQQPRDNTGRDSKITDFTGCFARDPATTGHRGIRVFRHTSEDQIDGTPSHDKKYILVYKGTSPRWAVARRCSAYARESSKYIKCSYFCFSRINQRSTPESDSNNNVAKGGTRGNC